MDATAFYMVCDATPLPLPGRPPTRLQHCGQGQLQREGRGEADPRHGARGGALPQHGRHPQVGAASQGKAAGGGTSCQVGGCWLLCSQRAQLWEELLVAAERPAAPVPSVLLRGRQLFSCRVPMYPAPLALPLGRDLKPENFLLENKDPGAAIKCTDFGLSVFFKPGQKFKEVVGSGEQRGGVGPIVLSLGMSRQGRLDGRLPLLAQCTHHAAHLPGRGFHTRLPASHSPPRLPPTLAHPRQPTTWPPRC